MIIYFYFQETLYIDVNCMITGTDILWVEPKFFDKTKRREFEEYLMWLVENRPGEAECSQITVSSTFNILYLLSDWS